MWYLHSDAGVEAFDFVPAMCALDYAMSEAGGSIKICAGNVPLRTAMPTATAATKRERRNRQWNLRNLAISDHILEITYPLRWDSA